MHSIDQPIGLGIIYSTSASDSGKRRAAIADRVVQLNSSHIDFQISAATQLSDTCYKYPEARKDAMDANAIPTLVRVLSSTKSSSLQTVAARALANINTLEKAQIFSQKSKVIPTLFRLLWSSDIDLLKAVCAALRHICWQLRAAVGEEFVTAVSPLIRLLSHKSDEIQRYATSALAKVCKHPWAAQEAQKRNCIIPAVTILESANTDSQMFACMLISNICASSDSARLEALKCEAIPIFFRLLLSEKADIQAAAAQALANINIHDRARPASIGAIPRLAELLEPELNVDSSVLSCACEALRNICWMNDSAKEAAEGVGAITLLNSLSKSSLDPQVRKLAGSALVQLGECSPLSCSPMRTGILWGISWRDQWWSAST